MSGTHLLRNGFAVEGCEFGVRRTTRRTAPASRRGPWNGRVGLLCDYGPGIRGQGKQDVKHETGGRGGRVQARPLLALGF